jgi:1-acyl-sn-glycerol-3-phosphate acyltransferase
MSTGDDVLRAAKSLWDVSLVKYLERYHRLEVVIDQPVPDQPVMFVCNHGFGGIVDLNVMAFCAALRRTGDDRPITFLVHQIAWTLGMGKLVERAGGRMATREAAEQAVAEGRHLVVFPGGDVDAGKCFKDRNTVTFAGRSGFACLAQDLGVPIVPVVTAGAGESLYVISDGKGLVRRFRLDDRLRVKAFPVSMSIPWGVSFGVTGLLPYLPLPTKLTTAVLPPVDPAARATRAELADHVHDLMQTRLDQLVRDRLPLIG